MKALIIKTSAIGDVVMALPAVKDLIKAWGGEVDWLVEPAAAGILTRADFLHRLWVMDRKGWVRDFKRFGRGSGVAFVEASKAISALRGEHYDWVIDLQGLLKSGFWSFLAKGAHKVGFGPDMQRNEGHWVFYDTFFPAVSMEIHAVERYRNALSWLTGKDASEIADYGLQENSEDREALASLGLDPDNTCRVALNPMTQWRTKLWTDHGFAGVADGLQEAGWEVVMTGGPGDAEAIEGILKKTAHPERILRLDGKTSLPTLAALYRRCRLLISTDTGPMHLAAAVGTPCLALFGPTAPGRTGPYGDHHQIVQTQLRCQPCFKKRCLTAEYPLHACMENIGVEQVLEAALGMLKSHSGGHLKGL